MLGPGLQVSVGTTIVTSSGWYKISFNVGVSASVIVNHILHRFSSVAPSGALCLSAVLP